MSAPLIRPEAPGDAAAVRDLLVAAFGGAAEADLVERLRAGGDAAIASVADAGGAVVGHVLFSPMRAPFRALALAPLAVAGPWRRQGIGAALVRDGLKRAAAQGWRGVFVLGDPAYYGRFGFDAGLAQGFSSLYAGPHLMAVGVDGPLPASQGPVCHATAFAALG